MSSFIPSATVEVPEIPLRRRVDLDPADTALVVVDLQNDFVSEGGSLVCPDASRTVPGIARLLERARRRGVRVAFTQDTHFEGDPEWRLWPEHCRAGSWGWRIVDELAPRDGELVVQKNRYDGFYGTWLEHFLTTTWKTRNLIVVGTVANICVLHTAASAGLRWFQVVVPADGISALTEFDQAGALRQISFLYAGRVTRSLEDIRF